jgi:hypothetical protein
MSAALGGSLRDFGIAEVFQLIGQQRKTGTLEVVRADRRISVRFDRGAVVGAEETGAYPGAALGAMLVRVGLLTPGRLAAAANALSGDEELYDALRRGGDLQTSQLDAIGDLLTQERLFELLRLSEGSFQFTPGPVAPRHDGGPLLPAEQILMDGLRMVDEWNSLDVDATDPDTIFRAIGSFDAFRADLGAEPGMAGAERLFLMIDGRLPARRIIDLSRLGSFEGARLLSLMRRAELIEPVAAVRPAPRRASTPRRVGAPAPILASVGPFALLAALVGWIAWSAPAPAPDGLLGDPVQRAERIGDTLRLRNAVEAHRFAHGSWPATLGELSATAAPDLGAASLAGAEVASYYYRRSGDGFVLLPPPGS